MVDVVMLADHRSPRRCALTGVVYPAIYLIRGYLPKPDDPEYVRDFCLFTLNSDPGYKNELIHRTSEEILGLRSPSVLGGGWLIVRHHTSSELASAYLKGIYDAGSSERTDKGYFSGGSRGCFTIVERPCMPGFIDNLVVCITIDKKTDAEAWHTIMPDGTTTNDLHRLYL